MPSNFVGKNYIAGFRLTFHQKSELKLLIKTDLGLGLEMGLGARVRVWEKINIKKIMKSSPGVTLKPAV